MVPFCSGDWEFDNENLHALVVSASVFSRQFNRYMKIVFRVYCSTFKMAFDKVYNYFRMF